MSRFDDYPDEMPTDPATDDYDAEWLRPFAEELRFAVSGPAPEPSSALAMVMAGGVSTDKGDLPVRAASNVRPAPQASGLPKWRKESKTMPIHTPAAGFVSALLTKLAGAGTAAKATVAGLTAAATMSVAGAAAGVLPGPAQGAVAGVVNAMSPLNLHGDDPTGAADTALAQVDKALTSVPVPVPVPAPIPSGAPAASTSAGPKLPVPVPSLPNIPAVAIPSIANLPVEVPVSLPACVTNLIPTGTTPDPTRLLAQIPGCITSVLGSAGMPVDVSRCVAAVLATVNGVLSPGSMGSLPQLNMSACMPFDTSACTSNTVSAVAPAGMASMPFVGDMISRMFAGFGGLPGLSNVPGCLPFDIGRCITSIVGNVPGLASGGVPDIDLSACLPTGITSGLPGLPAGVPGIPGMGSIPGLGGSIPFFGGGIPFFGG